jgi:hypothetical protein
MSEMIPIERIENKIYLIRGQRVMLDSDLAELYGVSTGRLNEQVKRNIERFPGDFMFSLTREEILSISQIAISSSQVSLKYSKNINALTENGVAMLSSVLRSKRAIQVNIQIMRIFTKLRKILADHRGLLDKINELERKTDNNTADIRLIFTTIRKLLTVEEKPKRRIGFVA